MSWITDFLKLRLPGFKKTITVRPSRSSTTPVLEIVDENDVAVKISASSQGLAASAQTVVGAAATDAATTQALANNLRTAMITAGFAKAS